MLKKLLVFTYLWYLVECFTGSFSINSSLTFSEPEGRILSIKLYLLPNCPHALDVLPSLKLWIQSQGIHDWQALPPTPFYPSPTLRIEYQDYGVNYIGKNEILNVI